MKVLHINAIYGYLSTGTIVKDIHELCVLKGIESSVACSKIFPGFETSGVYLIKNNILERKFHALMSRVTGKQGYYSSFATRCFLKHIQAMQPDIVHLHNLHSNFICLPVLMNYLNSHNIKTIITLHDCWFYTGGCTHYTNQKCYKWRESCGKCIDNHIKIFDSSHSVLLDRISFFQGRNNITVIGVSEWIKNESINNVFRGCANYTIYNGIDLSVFHPSPSYLRKQLRLEEKFVILGPATKWLDSSRKHYLKEFASRLKENEVLLLFGCDEDNIKVPKGVQLYGFTHNREELAQLYSMADVFANCSYEESLSLINVECQACGTPVVTFDNTGMSETVDGISGLRVQSGDYGELLNSCREIVSLDNEELKNIRISFIKKRFDKSSNYKKLIEIYTSILQE
jgi:putative colanic acid biosynthesis glycosyltransferase